MPENVIRAGHFPRFEEENFRKSREFADKEITEEKGATPGQLALAWLLQGGDGIVPILGTKSRERLEENAATAYETRTDENLRRIGEAIPCGSVAGGRYYEEQMCAVNR